MEVIDDVLRKYGELPPAALRDLTYKTLPMLEVAERGDDLDVEEFDAEVQLNAMLEGFADGLASLPEQETDPEVWVEVFDAMVEMSPGRGRAFDTLVDK